MVSYLMGSVFGYDKDKHSMYGLYFNLMEIENSVQH